MHLSVGIMLSVSMLEPKRWMPPRIKDGSDVDWWGEFAKFWDSELDSSVFSAGDGLL